MPPGFCAVLESEIQPYKDKKSNASTWGLIIASRSKKGAKGGAERGIMISCTP